jgi:hypothetical protein
MIVELGSRHDGQQSLLRLPIRHGVWDSSGRSRARARVFLLPFPGQAYDDAWSSHTSPAPRPPRLPSNGTVFLKYPPSQSAMKRTSLRGYGMLPASYHMHAFPCHLSPCGPISGPASSINITACSLLHLCKPPEDHTHASTRQGTPMIRHLCC